MVSLCMSGPWTAGVSKNRNREGGSPAVKAAGRQIGSSMPAVSMCGDSADGVCTGNMLSWMRGFSLESPIY